MSGIVPSEVKKFDTKQVGNVMVLEIIVDLDEDGAKILQSTFNRCLRKNHYNIVINMGDVRYISYDGVGVLVDYWYTFRKLKGNIKLTHTNLYAQRLFKMCSGLANMPECFSSEEAAIASFG